MYSPANYELHPTNNSYCPKCQSLLHILKPTTDTHPEVERSPVDSKFPAFSICFNCKYISEVNVGVVSLVEWRE